MAGRASFLALLLGLVVAVTSRRIKYDVDHEVYTVDNVHQMLVDRLDMLEKRVAEHPAEIDALRQEFKTEIDDLGKKHAKDISTLTAAFTAEIVSLKQANEMYTKTVGKSNKGNVLQPEVVMQTEANSIRPNSTDVKAIPVTTKGPDDGEIVDEVGHVDSGIDDTVEPPQSIIGQQLQHNRIRRAGVENDVAFFATLSQTTGHLGQNQNVKFDTVVTNIGNAYDMHLGVFRAPIAGIYTFSTTMVTDNRVSSHFGLFRNSQRLTILWLYGAENGYDGSSNTVVLHLNPNDDVSVQQLDSDKSIYGSDHCMFSGFLISQDDPQSAIVG